MSDTAEPAIAFHIALAQVDNHGDVRRSRIAMLAPIEGRCALRARGR